MLQADVENQALSGLNVDKLCEAEGRFNTEVGKRLKAADKYGGELLQPAQASHPCSSSPACCKSAAMVAYLRQCSRNGNEMQYSCSNVRHGCWVCKHAAVVTQLRYADPSVLTSVCTQMAASPLESSDPWCGQRLRAGRAPGACATSSLPSPSSLCSLWAPTLPWRLASLVSRLCAFACIPACALGSWGCVMHQ